MNFSSRKIRVVQIEDTRAIDNNWKPVPGSGIIDHCGCCGRAIEVHATIEDSATKERAIVGTQCAKRAGWKYYAGGLDIVSPTNSNYWKITRRQRLP